jgi:hypothetical protein
VIRTRSAFALEDLNFRRPELDLPAAVLDLRGYRGLAHGDARAGRIEDADPFVRQLPAGDVAFRQPHRFDHGLIENPHMMMLLQSRDDAAQHRERTGLVRLLDLDDLEAPCERSIALEILFVFRPGGRRYRAQIAARERRLK